MKKIFGLVVWMLIFMVPLAWCWEESAAIEDVFVRSGMTGTFVVYDSVRDEYVGVYRQRAEKRYSPASTFKIANSLIGLDAGAVADVDTVLPYRGPENPMMKEWKKDMGLRNAIKISNVPIYQELARRIGLKRMRAGLKKIRYGNQKTGKQVDRFWLEGPLKISAVEQVDFLYSLATEALPLSLAAQKQVREILLIEENAEYRLFGKTGWQNAMGAGVGWWVGWVEKSGNIYPFAVNLDMRSSADASKRIEIGRAALHAVGVV